MGVNRKVGLRRLLKLADFLDELPRKRFNYGHWVGSTWEGDPKLSCGTTACAVGWATTIPSFRRAGLRLTKDGDPSFRGYKSDLASMEFFALEDYEDYDLFHPQKPGEWKATPKQVAKKIRKFVKEQV